VQISADAEPKALNSARKNSDNMKTDIARIEEIETELEGLLVGLGFWERNRVLNLVDDLIVAEATMSRKA
jgi:hypothetical protein